MEPRAEEPDRFCSFLRTSADAAEFEIRLNSSCEEARLRLIVQTEANRISKSRFALEMKKLSRSSVDEIFRACSPSRLNFSIYV